MQASGFPNLLQFTRLNSVITDLKTQSEKARIELVTGREADLTSALGDRVGDAQLLRKAIDDLSQHRLSATRALGRASVTQTALERASGETALLGANLSNALGFQDEQGIALSGAQARTDLESAISSFNQRYEGRSLFAGDAVDQTPLADAQTLIDDIRTLYANAADAAQFEADLDFYFNDPAGGFETTIYQGGDGDAPRAEVGDGALISHSVKADEAPIRDLLRSLSSIVVAAEAAPSTDRTAVLENASNRVIEAGNDIVELRARIGVTEARLESELEAIDTEESVLTDSYNELTAVDSFEAATRLQQLESQLQASFVLTSRISQLSLVNFV